MRAKLKLKLVFILCAMCIVSPIYTWANNSIAVVSSPYDDVCLVFRNYGIPCEKIKYSDLEKSEIYRKYDALFFPSGMDDQYLSNIEVQQSGKKITSVKLSDNFFELDHNKFANLFKDFINEGGSAYFSGYSFKLLNSVYNNLEFFDNFPYLGVPGRIEAQLEGDLANFSLKKTSALYLGYTGWITIKSVSQAQVLCHGKFQTPRGEKEGPLSFLMKDVGEIIYTSYYSTIYSEFKRFHIMRIAGNKLLQSILEDISDNFQKPQTQISDKFLRHESSRTYRLNLKSGKNSIYISSDRTPFAFELYSQNKKLMAYVDSVQKTQRFNINSRGQDFCFIKIYPSSPKKEGLFAIVSAYGGLLSFGAWGVFKILIAALVLLVSISLLAYIVIRIMG